MKRIYLALLLLAGVSNAGLITHTDYTDGDTITAAKQNTNENTIYTEFNGNIESVNIKAGAVATSDIADLAVTAGKLDASITSTFTYVRSMSQYKKPELTFVGVSDVEIVGNTATQYQTCITFPDELRCVTENTGSATKYRRFTITAACTFLSGTEDSGLSGAAEASNAWYALYAVKSVVDTSKYVVCGTTNAPTQANSANLAAMFGGANGYSYLGTIRNGDAAGAVSDILDFAQAGSLTFFKNTNNGGSPSLTGTGIRMADTGGATTLTYAYAVGMGAAQTPGNIPQVLWSIAAGSVSGGLVVQDSGGARTYSQQNASSAASLRMLWMGATEGVKTSNGPVSSISYDFMLAGFNDAALSGTIGAPLY